MKQATPDVERIRARYRRLAPFYDRLELRPFRRLRARAIDLLELDAGQAALDLGCGSGLSLDRLSRAVRAEGRVVGFDLSKEMLTLAERRKRRQGCTNVLLVEADARRSPIRAGSLDAVLAFYTHDIMTSGDPQDLGCPDRAAVRGHARRGGVRLGHAAELEDVNVSRVDADAHRRHREERHRRR